MTTKEIVEEFSTLVDMEKEYTLKEMKELLGEVYKAKNGKPAKRVMKKKEDSDEDSDKEKKRGRPTKAKLNKDGTERKKRAPTAYNKYISMKSKELKAMEENAGKKATEIMKMAANSWSEMSDEEKEAYKNSLKVEEDNE
jgi:hypothetical protein